MSNNKSAETGRWARVCVDGSQASKTAVKVLREAGYYVITIPVSGRVGPELRIGRDVYRGLDEIERAAKGRGLSSK